MNRRYEQRGDYSNDMTRMQTERYRRDDEAADELRAAQRARADRPDALGSYVPSLRDREERADELARFDREERYDPVTGRVFYTYGHPHDLPYRASGNYGDDYLRHGSQHLDPRDRGLRSVQRDPWSSIESLPPTRQYYFGDYEAERQARHAQESWPNYAAPDYSRSPGDGTYPGFRGYLGSGGYQAFGTLPSFEVQRPGRDLPNLRGRGPKGYVRSDERMKEDISERLTDAPDIDASDILVESRNGVVTLTGTVQQRWMKHRVEDIVDRCPGVKDINNQLTVAASTVSSRTGSEALGREPIEPDSGYGSALGSGAVRKKN